MDWLTDMGVFPRTLISASLTYFYVVLLVRVSGKRTVARMNSFDWIVNVAMGSLMATAMASPDKAPAVWIAMATVIGLQWILTKLTLGSDHVSALIKEEPQALVTNGEMNRTAMVRTRVNEDEIRAAIRSAGLSELDEVGAMILESNGRISVIARAEDAPDDPPPPAFNEVGEKLFE